VAESSSGASLENCAATCASICLRVSSSSCGSDSDAEGGSDIAAEETQAPAKEEKTEPEAPAKPKERLVATGAYDSDAFRVKVLSLINAKKFDTAELYIKSRPNDAPNENLDFLKKRLKKAKERQ